MIDLDSVDEYHASLPTSRRRLLLSLSAIVVAEITEPLAGTFDPLLGDQLISLRLSEFAITATVLELDEPAPLVVVVVSHCSCKWFGDLCHNRIKTGWARVMPRGRRFRSSLRRFC